jgi:hypothetical protein
LFPAELGVGADEFEEFAGAENGEFGAAFFSKYVSMQSGNIELNEFAMVEGRWVVRACREPRFQIAVKMKS